MLSVTHIMPVRYQWWGRNATVHNLKPKWNAQTQRSQERTKLCS